LDSNELIKGELETREKLLGKAGLPEDFRIFKKNFYFDKNE
jgi:serum/glucocorticoid-regulated kinase 2